MRSYFYNVKKLDSTFPKRDKLTPDLGFRVRNSSWIFKLGFRVGCSSWDFELDFRVRISSWVSSWNYRVKISSLIFELGFRVKRPSHGKLKLANSCWQTQVGVCEQHKNSRQTRFYLTPTVCKRCSTFKFKGSILLQFFDRFVFVVWQVVFWLCSFYFRNA